MKAIAAGLLCGLLWGLSSVACAPSDEGTAGGNASDVTPGAPLQENSDGPVVAGRTLRHVTLPDLSPMVPPVQGQIRGAYEVVEAQLGEPQPSVTPLAGAYGNLGRLLLAADYPDSAEPSFLNARALDAGDYRWPYYLAHISRERGQLEQARAFFEEVLGHVPNDVDTLVWLGDIWLSLGRPEQAQPRFRRALELAPGSLSARYGVGRTALALQDYRGAVDHLVRVLEQDPEAAAAHYPLALAYQGLGDAANANVHLRLRQEHQILPADPLMVELDELLESPQAYETRGIRALDRGAWDEAAAHFTAGLEISPDSAALRHRLGTALYMQGDAAGARAAFERAVEASPDYFPAQFSLGVLFQDEGRHREAIARFEEALRHRPTYIEARLRLAASLRDVRRSGEALAQYGEVLALDAGVVDARFGRAMVLVEMGRYREARDQLRAAREAYRDEPAFAHALARVLAGAPDPAVRNGREALSLIEPLLESAPRTIDLGETYAMALAASGEFGQAAALQNDLVRGAEGAGMSEVIPRLRANLARYQQGRMPDAPWAPGEVP